MLVKNILAVTFRSCDTFILKEYMNVFWGKLLYIIFYFCIQPCFKFNLIIFFSKYWWFFFFFIVTFGCIKSRVAFLPVIIHVWL